MSVCLSIANAECPANPRIVPGLGGERERQEFTLTVP